MTDNSGRSLCSVPASPHREKQLCDVTVLMSLVAEVLPQVVGALQAVDPDERGAALNQLAQVRSS